MSFAKIDYKYNISSMSKDDDLKWFVMRDLTRPIAKLPAYLMLKDMGIEFYTPMVSKVVTRGGKRVRKQMPFIHDLIFVHATDFFPNDNVASRFSTNIVFSILFSYPCVKSS